MELKSLEAVGAGAGGGGAVMVSSIAAQPATARQGGGHGRYLQWLWAWPFPLLLLALWQWSAVQGWVPEQVLPPPAVVWDTFASLAASGELWDHLGISLVRVFTGFAIGLGLGWLLGAAMGLSTTLRDYVFPLFKAFSQVPTIRRERPSRRGAQGAGFCGCGWLWRKRWAFVRLPSGITPYPLPS